MSNSQRRTRPANSGRPTKLTAAIIRSIGKHLKLGLSRDTAAELEGVGRRTFARWLATGRREDSGLFRQFWHEVKKAEAAAVAAHAATVRKAALGWTEKT